MKRLLLFLISTALIFSGCKTPEKEPEKTIVISIAHSTELRSYLAQVRDNFHAQNPILPDGRKIRIELMSKMPLQASKSISSGELKIHGWIASSQALVEYTNGQLINLGARQIDCKAIFKSPMVFAVSRDQLDAIGAADQVLDWEQFAANYLLSKIPGKEVRYSHADPKLSSTGPGALLELAFLAVRTTGDNLVLDQLKQEGVLDRLRQFEQMASAYGLSESALLDRASRMEKGSIRMVLTTEQQLALYNSYRGLRPSTLAAVYPREGVHVENYAVCTSQSGWTTVSHQAALNLFTRYLLTGDAQLLARDNGFRPAVEGLPFGGPLDPDFGANTSLPSKPVSHIDGNVLGFLLDQWRELQRPAAIVLVLDTSGSMDDGDRLKDAKQQLRTLLADTPSRDLRGLVTFSSDVNVQSEPTTDAMQVLKLLDATVAHGGSSIYDAIEKSFLMLAAGQYAPYRRSVIEVTDGQDKNSKRAPAIVQTNLEAVAAQSDINLFVIGLVGETQDFTELRKLTEAVGGRFEQSEAAALERTFEEVWKSL